MPPKQIIALATHHHAQLKGHALNDRFGQVDYDLGYIDLEEKTLQPLDNHFGPKVLPMS